MLSTFSGFLQILFLKIFRFEAVASYDSIPSESRSDAKPISIALVSTFERFTNGSSPSSGRIVPNITSCMFFDLIFVLRFDHSLLPFAQPLHYLFLLHLLGLRLTELPNRAILVTINRSGLLRNVKIRRRLALNLQFNLFFSLLASFSFSLALISQAFLIVLQVMLELIHPYSFNFDCIQKLRSIFILL